MIDIFQGSGKPFTLSVFDKVVGDLGVPWASMWALISVETRGFGYLSDRRPKILFERHVFHARTGGVYGASNPDISSREPGGYGNEAGEYQRLKRAMLLDRRVALESASWGIGQVMGFNASEIGYTNVLKMIEKFKEGEDAQLEGAANFIMAKKPLWQAFKAQDWAKVAFFYNGKNYAINRYDKKLKGNFEAFQKPGKMPDIDLRAAQARLAYLGFYALDVDGLDGNHTQKAMTAFQKSHGLTESGSLDEATEGKLNDLVKF